MEFAFIYHRLGVKVQVIEDLNCILPMFDKDISDKFWTIAERKGIAFQRGTKVNRIGTGLNQEAVVIYEKDEKEAFALSEKVLMTIGRVSNFEELNIEVTAISTRKNGRGILVNEYMQTNHPWIYAIGEI